MSTMNVNESSSPAFNPNTPSSPGFNLNSPLPIATKSISPEMVSPPYIGESPVVAPRRKYPEVLNISSDKDSALTFRIKCDISIANAIRRTILSDIPVVVIDTNKCIIETNQCGSGQHNEYLKHRMDCIPVMVPPDKMVDFVRNYYLSVDVKNETVQIKHATTEHFKLLRKESETPTEHLFDTNDVFPPYQNKYYIEFAHLKPAVGSGDVISGGALKFTADFKIATAKENAAYNAVYKCTAPFTVDEAAAKTEWTKREQKMKDEGKSESEIGLQKSNFWALDAQRIYVPNSLDFEVKTLGMYSNREIVKHACAILANKFDAAPAKFRAGQEYVIKKSVGQVSDDPESQTYMIELGDEDYTMGKVIEYILFDYFYFVDEPQIRFCAFKKMHPHDGYGVLQVSLAKSEGVEQNDAKMFALLDSVCKIGVKLFSHIESHFGEGKSSRV